MRYDKDRPHAEKKKRPLKGRAMHIGNEELCTCSHGAQRQRSELREKKGGLITGEVHEMLSKEKGMGVRKKVVILSRCSHLVQLLTAPRRIENMLSSHI